MQGYGGSFSSSGQSWQPHPSGRVAGSLKIVGYLYLAFAALAALALCLSLKGGIDMAQLSTMAVLGVLGAFHLFLSKAADGKKEWARFVSVVAALPLMFAFPIGSILGFIIIANALKSWDVNPE